MNKAGSVEGWSSPWLATTNWSVVVTAGGPPSRAAEEALADLLRTYWYPLYVYVRRRGHPPEDAQDLIQGFFLELVGKGRLRFADPERIRKITLGTPAVITVQPQGQVMSVGNSITLSVVAQGTPPLSYQWKLNGVSIPGATNAATWWTSWHHFAFVQEGSAKRIYIDGNLFLEGNNTAPLVNDFIDLWLGSDGTGASNLHGYLDDLAVYGSALSEENIALLATGTSPLDLQAAIPAITVIRQGADLKITFTGTLQSADAITGPWIDVGGAVSPVTIKPFGTASFYPKRFYRAKQ